MEEEAEYEGYEPGEYSSTGTSGFGSRERFFSRGGQQRSSGSPGQGLRGSFGAGSRQFEQGSMRGQEYQQARGGLSRGSFAGRGPQGYKRSDERIAEDINEMLTQDADIDASNITVDVQSGEVTLKGTVSDREDKRRAEDIAESASGVKDVQNQLRVKREDESETESGKREKSEDKRSHRQQIAS
jgi:osmotically-inducible protein OsmY